MQFPRFFDAVQILTENAAISGATDGPVEKILFKENFANIPTNDSVSLKLAELTAAELMRQLRQQRDQLLSATDWWCVSDRQATPEQLAYRQTLRDLPATATPALDENGNLTGVNWPTKPE